MPTRPAEEDDPFLAAARRSGRQQQRDPFEVAAEEAERRAAASEIVRTQREDIQAALPRLPSVGRATSPAPILRRLPSVTEARERERRRREAGIPYSQRQRDVPVRTGGDTILQDETARGFDLDAYAARRGAEGPLRRGLKGFRDDVREGMARVALHAVDPQRTTPRSLSSSPLREALAGRLRENVRVLEGRRRAIEELEEHKDFGDKALAEAVRFTAPFMLPGPGALGRATQAAVLGRAAASAFRRLLARSARLGAEFGAITGGQEAAHGGTLGEVARATGEGAVSGAMFGPLEAVAGAGRPLVRAGGGAVIGGLAGGVTGGDIASAGQGATAGAGAALAGRPLVEAAGAGVRRARGAIRRAREVRALRNIGRGGREAAGGAGAIRAAWEARLRERAARGVAAERAARIRELEAEGGARLEVQPGGDVANVERKADVGGVEAGAREAGAANARAVQEGGASAYDRLLAELDAEVRGPAEVATGAAIESRFPATAAVRIPGRAEPLTGGSHGAIALRYPELMQTPGAEAGFLDRSGRWMSRAEAEEGRRAIGASASNRGRITSEELGAVGSLYTMADEARLGEMNRLRAAQGLPELTRREFIEQVLPPGHRARRLLEGGTAAAGITAAVLGDDDQADPFLAAALVPFAPRAARVGSGRYFSRLERAIERAPLKIATAREWLNYLQKQPLPREELDRLLRDEFERSPNVRLDREQVLLRVRERATPLDEVSYPGDAPQVYRVIVNGDEHSTWNTLERAKQEANKLREDMISDGASELFDVVEDVGPTGSVFRVVSRSPMGRVPGAVRAWNKLSGRRYETAEDAWADARSSYEDVWFENPVYVDDTGGVDDAATRFGESSYVLPGGRDHKEIIITAQDLPGAPFTAEAHWPGVDNPLGHVRLNYRRSSRGERVAFIEELQSDLHVQGRAGGYRRPTDRLAYERRARRWEDAARRWNEEAERMERTRGRDVVRVAREAGYDETDAVAGNDWSGRAGLWLKERIAELRKRAIRAEILASHTRDAHAQILARAPDAPFKRTEDWAGLLWRRVMDEAATEGVERVAWTTGRQQADRYGLQHYASKISWDPKSKRLSAWRKGVQDDAPSLVEIVDREHLADYIGKEAAEKLLAQPPQRGGRWTTVKLSEEITRHDYMVPVPDGALDEEMVAGYVLDVGGDLKAVREGDPRAFHGTSPHAAKAFVERQVAAPGSHVLAGEELAIGGRGMLHFYDTIVPKVVRDWGRRRGIRLEIEPTRVRVGGHASWRPEGGGLTDAVRDPTDGYWYTTVPSVRLTREILERIRTEGQELYGAAPLIGAGAGAAAAGATPAEAQQDDEPRSPWAGRIAAALGGAAAGAGLVLGARRLASRAAGRAGRRLLERGAEREIEAAARPAERALPAPREPAPGTPTMVSEVPPTRTPDFDVHINRIMRDPAGVEEIADRVRRLKEAGALERRVVSRRDMQEQAQRISVARVVRDLGKPLSGPEGLALKGAYEENAEYLRQAYRQIETMTPEGAEYERMLEAVQAMEQHGDLLLSRYIKGASENGRQLGALRFLAATSRDPLVWLARARRVAGRPITDAERAEIGRLAVANDRDAVARYVQRLRHVSAWEKASKVVRSFMLSGPASVGRAVVGNAARATAFTATRPAAVAVDALMAAILGRPRAMGPLVSRVRARAAARGFARGLREVPAALRGAFKGEQRIEGAATMFETPWLEFLTDLPFNFQSAIDRPFRRAAYYRSVAEQAEVLAREAGLRGVDRQAYIERLIQEPTPDMVMLAHEAGMRAVFQGESLLGRVAKAVGAEARQGVKVLGHRFKAHPAARFAYDLNVPFRQTPSTVASTALRATPLGSLATAGDLHRLIRAVHEGEDQTIVRELQRQLGEGAGLWIGGLGPVALGYHWYRSGRMTAESPEGAGQQAVEGAAGRGRYMVRVGTQWRRMTQLQPIAAQLAFGARLAQALEEGNDWLGAGAAAMFGAGRTVLDSPFLQGVSNIVGALEEPDVGARAQRYARGLASASVPAIVRDVAEATDPTIRRPETTGQAIQARLPGASRGVPPALNPVTGERVQRAPTTLQNVWTAFFDVLGSRPATDDPVIQELVRVGAGVTPLKRQRLESAEDYEARVREYASAVYLALTEAIGGPEYQGLEAELVDAAALPENVGLSEDRILRQLQQEYLEDIVRETRHAVTRERRRAS